MKLRILGLRQLVPIIGLLTFTHAPSLYASTRLVQFIGTINVQYSTPELNNRNKVSICTIAIINLSKSDQIVESVNFFETRYDNSTKKAYFTDTKGVSIFGGPAAASITYGCVGETLPKEGGFCIINYAMHSLPWTGRISTCAGVIKAKDKNASKPGFLIAAGSIETRQELKAIAGQLSGALYQSGVYIATVAHPDSPVA